VRPLRAPQPTLGACSKQVREESAVPTDSGRRNGQRHTRQTISKDHSEATSGADDLAVVYSLTAPTAPGVPTSRVPAGTGEIDVAAPATEGPVVTGLVGLDSATGRERWRSPGVVTWRYGPPRRSHPPTDRFR
jgi:hypothetical protein